MKKINKKLVIFLVLLVWIIFSVGYISWDVWSDFKVEKMANAYQNGYAQAIVNVADEANKCSQTGVPLNVGKDDSGKDKVVTIVGVSCLQAAQEIQEGTVKTPAKK